MKLNTVTLGKNQVIITNDNMLQFNSYDIKVCTYNEDTKELKLDGNTWDFSQTTRKYFKKFINDFTSLKYETKKQFMADNNITL